MKVFYYYDQAAHRAANACGRDYTPAYLPLMFKNMGVTAHPITPEELLSNPPGKGDVLFIGSDHLDAERSASLAQAAEKGCLLIGFGTDVANELFGCRADRLPPADDPYGVVGYFTFRGQSEPLPVLGAFARLDGADGDTAGEIEADGKVYPGCIRQKNTCYFVFDLPATLWRSADGHPTVESVLEGFPFPRVPDGCVIPNDYNADIAFADCYQQFLQGILRQAGIPMLHPLPPKDGKAADLLLYFAGDDDAGGADIDLIASERMHERGLPYHLNLMPTADGQGFVIDRAQADLIRSRGHELSLHYNFTQYPYTKDGWKVQHDLFEEHFGQTAVGPVNHCVIQIGSSAERCRRQKQLGALGDNNKIQSAFDPDDINAFNVTGFRFGSAFPRFAIDDAAHGNQNLGFCEVYASYYEPRIYEGTDAEYDKIYRYLEAGVFYGRTLQLFVHPHYISDIITPAEPALRAIDAAMEHVRRRGWQVVTCGPDALIRWWHDRAACRILALTPNGFTLDNPTGRPITLRLPDGVRGVTVDGKPTEPERKSIAGENALLLTLAPAQKIVHYIR